MANRRGHVATGLCLMLFGLWHLFNHIKLHALNPMPYNSPLWFPITKYKYLELLLIMVGSTIFLSMDLFIAPKRHQPLDPDGTIPTNHLHNFEHDTIFMTLLVYSAFAIVLDRIPNRAQHVLTYLLAAITFSQELLLFHLHSIDHKGLEGQYHFLLQLVILVSLITILMGIGFPKSFIVSFVRSLSLFFQGLWLVVMGFMLWTPSLIAKGCFLNFEVGHYVVKCSSDKALYRAKSLVNLQFSWFVIGVTIFAMYFYLVLVRIYGDKVEYYSVGKEEQDLEDEESYDAKKIEQFGKIINARKDFSPVDMKG